MYKRSNIFCCGSPIIHTALLKDIFDNRSLCNNMLIIDEPFNAILKKANKDILNKKDRLNGQSCLEQTWLPEFLKNVKLLAMENTEKSRNKTWKISPGHYSVKSKNYNLFFALSLFGASFEAKNEEGKSINEVFLKNLDNDIENFKKLNAFTKWWILQVTDHHWLKLIKIAAVQKFENCFDILIENKSNVNVCNSEEGLQRHIDRFKMYH